MEETALAATLSQLIDPDLGCSLIEAAGGPVLGARLLEAAQSLGSVEEVFAYRRADGAQPEMMASSSDLDEVEARVRLYTHRFHPFDPAARTLSATPPGSGFMQSVTAGEIERLDYRSLCFERPRFADKLCFGWRQPGQWLVLNFYRRRVDEDLATSQLAALANIALTAMARRSASPTSLAARVEQKLARLCPELTRREREVCARTLIGVTAKAIAAELGIRPASVLTYRQRAYQRLEIDRASALIERLLA